MLSFRLLWQIPAALLLGVILVLSLNEFAVASGSRRTKDISYLPPATTPSDPTDRHLLDVFSPRKRDPGGRPVVLFIHGGNWNSGNKNLYAILGRRLARQGAVAVIINYRLSPNVEVPAMAEDCAQAVRWATQHIAEYGGDPDRIFVMGHSAGGGLAALLATDDQLFTKIGLAKNPVKGAILDDPGGLDMFDYLKKMEYPGDDQYLVPFGKDPSIWRDMSPMYHVRADSPPMLVYVGEHTYPSIASSTRTFNQRLLELGARHTFTVIPGKKHIAMVTQLFWQHNIIYRDLLKLVGVKP
ncbi:alpha/beta hydrolase [Spirosoma endophyticum]|uniref:Acetyl esterase/lipase n=1 Tax=Spirosoma endophyticum TaxID=662367 RepID=A0A1I1UT66_9BACT|nr:alpha/beta hydrolase [Spirosoma endophyticum]SFD71180.1 Acetyl esterase/lipase [Spirosoma endophyticum]